MKLLKQLFVTFALLGAVACQKEYNPDPLPSGGGGGGSSSGGGNNVVAKLSKETLVTGNQSQTNTYDYDAAGRLMNFVSTTVVNGQNIVSSTTFNRDGSGKTVSYLVKFSSGGFPAEGMLYTCHYTANAVLFDYAVARYNLSGIPVIDSSVFQASGDLITGIRVFKNVANSGFQPSGATELSYDVAGNLNEYKFYSYDYTTASLVLQSSSTFVYDNKPNALYLGGQEGFIVGSDARMGKNNYTKKVTNSISPAGAVVTYNFVYTYNVNNQPSKSTVADTNGTTGTVTYTY